jgi:hypothetical protein
MEEQQQQQQSAPASSQRMPLLWSQDRVATADGTTILDSLSSSVSQSATRAADGGLLLSLTSPSGLASIVDVTLGEVRSSCRCYCCVAVGSAAAKRSCRRPGGGSERLHSSSPPCPGRSQPDAPPTRCPPLV